MTTEIRTITIVRASQTVGGSTFTVLDLSLVARNTRSRLLRTTINVNTFGSLLTASQFLVLIVPWRVPVIGVSLLTFGIPFLEEMEPLAATMDGYNIIGTPTNLVQQLPSAEIEIDFSKILRRGVAVLSKGTRSNERAGWSVLLANLQTATLDFDIAITAEVEDTWIGGGGSKANLDIENAEWDEGENQ